MILMDEFSSKTACMTTRKMEIPENFLDEFSMICQWGLKREYYLIYFLIVPVAHRY